MKIQSCTAKLLKYPTLAALAAVAGAAGASEHPEQKPAAPGENQPTTAPAPQQTPQPYAGIVAPDTRDADAEEEEPVPQYYLGEIAPEPIEEAPKKKQ